jgi:hypothetical protein
VGSGSNKEQLQRMSLRRISFLICLTVSLLCLTAGYGIAGKWVGALIAIITGLAWLPARKYPDSDLPFICLAGSVCLAIVGMFIGSLPLLMICGSGFALATWDLIFLDDTLGTNSFGEQTRRYENKHLQALALALGCGLIVAFVGRLLNFQIPFIVMMLFIALAIFGLERIWGTIKKRNIH